MFSLLNIKYKNILNIDKLEFDKYKVTSIIGKSGSGKSTLLKMLNKMITPDNGEIIYEGKNIKELDSIFLRREVVMLGQTPIMFNWSIRDNLLIGRKFAEKSDVSIKKMSEVLTSLSIDKDLEESVNNLSIGEKQRIALARLILTDAKVFLVDEPSSALDEKTRDSIIGYLVKFCKENKKTLIMISHSSYIVDKFSDVIIEIENNTITKRRG